MVLLRERQERQAFLLQGQTFRGALLPRLKMSPRPGRYGPAFLTDPYSMSYLNSGHFLAESDLKVLTYGPPYSATTKNWHPRLVSAYLPPFASCLTFLALQAGLGSSSAYEPNPYGLLHPDRPLAYLEFPGVSCRVEQRLSSAREPKSLPQGDYLIRSRSGLPPR